MSGCARLSALIVVRMCSERRCHFGATSATSSEFSVCTISYACLLRLNGTSCDGNALAFFISSRTTLQVVLLPGKGFRNETFYINHNGGLT